MTSEAWKKRIKKACKSIGTYEPAYDDMIKTLADILTQRDDCYELYETSGAEPVIEHTNKIGATNYERNPVLRTWMELNTQALAYWRELGLTPAGFKKLSDGVIVKAPKKTGLELALEKMSAAQ